MNEASELKEKQTDSGESAVVAGTERLRRSTAPALDEILGARLRVLDEGFVRVIDYMGNDSSIVQAARVSYGAGTKKMGEDRALIRELMRHLHTTPFEMCEIKLHVRTPINVWRHWVRHRTASINEYSTRDSIANFAYKTKASEWRTHPAKDSAAGGAFVAVETGKLLSAREQEQKKRRAKSTSSASKPGSRASRQGRTCRYRPTPKHIGRSICTTCCTSCMCAWKNTLRRTCAATPS
jgi:Thymidylate synthase complementing protein